MLCGREREEKRESRKERAHEVEGWGKRGGEMLRTIKQRVRARELWQVPD